MAIQQNFGNPARSDNMRAIRSFGNRTTELRLRAILIRHGVGGWKLHDKRILGIPDFFFAKQRTAVFVDGCFWHACPRCGHIPKTNVQYWSQKLARVSRRDSFVNRQLRRSGYKVIRIRECSVRSNPADCVRRISRALEIGAGRLGGRTKA